MLACLIGYVGNAGAMLSHLGAMLARLEAMLAQHVTRNARRRTKTQTKIEMPQKSRNPMVRRVRPRFPQLPPRVGGGFGARLAQLWGPCWPTLGAASPLLGHVGPVWALCCPILTLCWPILNMCCPILALCWPKKRRTAKTMEKPMDSQGFGNHIEAMLAHL